MRIDDNKVAESLQANFEELAGEDGNLDATELQAAAEGNAASGSSALAARALQTNPELALALDSADGSDDGVITAEGIQAYLEGSEEAEAAPEGSEAAPEGSEVSGDESSNIQGQLLGAAQALFDLFEAISGGDQSISQDDLTNFVTSRTESNPAIASAVQSILDSGIFEQIAGEDGEINLQDLESLLGQPNEAEDPSDVFPQGPDIGLF